MPQKPLAYWDSQVPSVMGELFARTKVGAEYNRMRETQARRDMLEHDWEDVLFGRICRIYKSKTIRDWARDTITAEYNPYRRIVDLLATLYKWGATRELADKGANEIARELWREAQIDQFMALANFWWVGLGDAIILPDFRSPTLRYTLWTGESTTIQQDPTNPSKCVWAWHEEALCHSSSVTQVRRIYVDAEVWRETDQHGETILEIPLGMGRFPGVVIHSRMRDAGRFWGGEDFRPAAGTNLKIGVDMFRLERIMNFQSEVQPVYQGKPRELAKSMGKGADKLWAAPGIFDTLDLQATPEPILQVIDKRLALLASLFDVDAELFFNTVNATSGWQLRLKRASLEARRVGDLKIARDVERELLIVTALWSERFHPTLRLDSMKAEFSSLNFHEEPMQEDPRAQNANWEERRRMGVIDRVTILRELDPDLSEEQALERAEKIAANEAKVNRIHITHGIEANGKSPQQNGSDGGKQRARNAGEDVEDDDNIDVEAEAADALRRIRA